MDKSWEELFLYHPCPWRYDLFNEFGDDDELEIEWQRFSWLKNLSWI